MDLQLQARVASGISVVSEGYEKDIDTFCPFTRKLKSIGSSEKLRFDAYHVLDLVDIG